MLGAVAGNEDGRQRVSAQLQNVERTISNAVTILDAYIACELQHCLRSRRAGMSAYAQGLQSPCGIWNLCEPGIHAPLAEQYYILLPPNAVCMTLRLLTGSVRSDKDV